MASYVPVPVDVPDVVLRPTADELRTILFAGQLTKSKGVVELLRAADRLWRERRQFVLHVAGDGPLRPVVEDVSKQWPGKLVVHGLLPFADVDALMAEMDLLVQPSHWEGVSGSVLEALAKGTPVIATAAGGMQKLAESQVVECVEPRDADGLRLALVRLMERPERRAELSRRGRAYVLAHHTWDLVFEQFCELYVKLGVSVRSAAADGR